MIERKGDLWAEFGHLDHYVGISTNGFVKNNGCAVMGRGCAKQATEMFPGIARSLGLYIKRNGNVPGWLTFDDGEDWGNHGRLIILPVKHNWWEKADLNLVQMSINWLKNYAESNNIVSTFHVPRLGCGNGKLDWLSQVRPLMLKLPDNVVVHS